MLKNKVMFLMSGAVLGMSMSAVAADEAAGVKASPDLTVTRVDVGRQEILRNADLLVREANELMSQGAYRDAIKKFISARQALARYATGDKFRDKIEVCDRRIEKCYYKMADEAMSRADDSATVGDFEEAIKLCREAQKFCPERRDELAKKIVYYEKRRDAAITKEDISVAKLEPGKAAQDYQIQVLLEQGRALARRNELMQSRRKFEEILLIDPYNSDALKDLLGVNTRIKDNAEARSAATSRHLIGQTMWAGALPVAADATVGTPENQLDAPTDKVVESELEKKLKAIRIPSFYLDDGMQTFAGVMAQLSTRCRNLDPERRGINFVVKNKPQDSGEPEMLKAISIDDASVYDILEQLQKRGDLTFKIDRNAVFVAAPGVSLENMTVRIFPMDVPVGMDSKRLQELLTSSTGVTFDAGASVAIMGNHVVVRHTPESLKKIEDELHYIGNDQMPMVQVMFKFLEVSQNDLDELAFNWLYSRPNSGSDFSGFRPGVNSLTPGRASDDPNSGVKFNENSNELLRHYGSDGTAKTGDRATTFDDATFNFQWGDQKQVLSFSLYALDWADSSDIIYSPRVTTISGQTAHIDMSTTRYFPGEWENIDNESDDNWQVVIDDAQPTLDDEQHLGVKFSITPEVSGNRIHVPINIPIKQFYDWLDVDTRSIGSDGSIEGEKIRKAIFNVRTIETDVTLKDGETVLIGSIANDVTTLMNDKIPILGDIPFIGRLFQSKGTKSEKLNLLVFMTCRIVKPDGSAEFPDNVVNEGVPFFPQPL